MLGRPREAADAAYAAATAAAAAGQGAAEPPRGPKELLTAIKAKCTSPSDTAYVENVLRTLA